jgi:endonuclease III
VAGPLRQEFAQDLLQQIVPPEIRYSLHVNAVAHGRQTCTSRSPRCRACPIGGLCRNRRTRP